MCSRQHLQRYRSLAKNIDGLTRACNDDVDFWVTSAFAFSFVEVNGDTVCSEIDSVGLETGESALALYARKQINRCSC